MNIKCPRCGKEIKNLTIKKSLSEGYLKVKCTNMITLPLKIKKKVVMCDFNGFVKIPE